MLSYDNALSVNGQGPASPTNLPAARQAIPTSTETICPVANGTSMVNGHAPKYHHIWLVTGPAGCGKSTVAKHIATSLNLPYIEGDEFHPKANIEKMSSGIPLTDADRWDWLTLLREESLHQLAAGNDGVVLTCSALKRKYRDVIRVAPYYSHDVLLHFIYLHAPEQVLLDRVTKRQNHYMGANMVHSQFTILEPPSADETDVISIDVSVSIDAVKQDALAKAITSMEMMG